MDKPTLLVTTTHAVEGRTITAYKGLVGGDAILGANMFRDFFAGIRDLVGGRSGSYEKVLRKAKQEAIEDMMEQAREARRQCRGRRRPRLRDHPGAGRRQHADGVGVGHRGRARVATACIPRCRSSSSPRCRAPVTGCCSGRRWRR